jgi:hypothetical protein
MEALEIGGYLLRQSQNLFYLKGTCKVFCPWLLPRGFTF